MDELLNADGLEVASSIFFSYLYEFLMDHYHDDFFLNGLDTLHRYDDETKPQQINIHILIEYFGFIPWRRTSVEWMRKRMVASCKVSDDIKFLELIMESNFIASRLCALKWLSPKDKNTFMTYFCTRLVDDRHVVLLYDRSYQREDTIAKKYVRDIVERLTFVHYIAETDESAESFQKLARLLASSALFSKGFIDDVVSPGYMTRYQRALLEILLDNNKARGPSRMVLI